MTSLVGFSACLPRCPGPPSQKRRRRRGPAGRAAWRTSDAERWSAALGGTKERSGGPGCVRKACFTSFIVSPKKSPFEPITPFVIPLHRPWSPGIPEAALCIFFCTVFPWQLASFSLLSNIYSLRVSQANAQPKISVSLSGCPGAVCSTAPEFDRLGCSARSALPRDLGHTGPSVSRHSPHLEHGVTGTGLPWQDAQDTRQGQGSSSPSLTTQFRAHTLPHLLLSSLLPSSPPSSALLCSWNRSWPTLALIACV